VTLAPSSITSGYGAIESADIDPSLDRLRDILSQMD